jgi:hypothetical protein
MNRALHGAFLACLPVAAVLGLAGEWGWSAVVFLVGTPVLWTLRNAFAGRTAKAFLGRAAPRDEFLPTDDPMVQAWAEPGERFLPPVGIIDWTQYLQTMDEIDRIASVKAAMRQLVLTTRRLIVLWLDRPTKGDIRLSDVISARTLTPPGKPYSGAELALEVRASTPDGILQTMWAMRRQDAQHILSKLEGFRRQL